MRLSYGLYPTEADLSGLQEFFPKVNLWKLYEVEGYHKSWPQYCMVSSQQNETVCRVKLKTFIVRW